jgi:hypothetical protein
MSVEYFDNEIVVRIPRSKYNASVKKLIDEVEKPLKESEVFFDVEAGSDLEMLLLDVKKNRQDTTTRFLEKTGII